MKPAFTPVPEIHLPSGQIVPAFEVSTFLCGKRVVPTETPDAEPRCVVDSRDDLAPWCYMSYCQARQACIAAGWQLITETQWLAIAYDVARHPANWTGGARPATMDLDGRQMMITRDTAADIWNAYREIEVGEKLLADMKSQREMMHVDKHAPTLRDAFGRVRQLQLGIPSGENAHRLLDVSPTLAESVIRAHIQNKRAELAEINERARIELGINDHV